MTSKEFQRPIQEAIFTIREPWVALPNFSPVGWCECDMFTITRKSGLFEEFEIKRFGHDVTRDFDKTVGGFGDGCSKYEALASGNHPAAPSRFSIIMLPDTMRYGLERIPEFVGLYHYLAQSGRIVCKRKPKLLHRRRWVSNGMIDVHIAAALSARLRDGRGW